VKFAKPEEYQDQKFQPYLRNELNVRPWAIPGTPGLEHRIGGLEKRHITGEVTSDPLNHEFMVKLRDEKIQKIADDIPLQDVYGDPEGDLLVLSWGGTFGAIRDAVNRVRDKGYKVSQAHLFYLNPMPKNLGDIIHSFKKILIPELNLGQLAFIIRAKYLVPVYQLNKIQGLPFRSSEIEKKIYELLGVN
jgi:2-oxoglutarate ferredoxin oxidoreductase subunit alpha